MTTITRAALAVLTAATLGGPALSADRDYDLPPFDAVEIATGIDAVVTHADTRSIRASVRDERHFDHLELDVRDGTLRARLERSFLDFILEGGILGEIVRGGDTGVRLEIALPRLEEVEARSGASVTVTDVPSGAGFEADAASGATITVTGIDAREVELSASSGASVTASGTCVEVEAGASSGARIDSAALACEDADATASSGASVAVNASGAVAARASSGGNVQVAGSPARVQVDESSGGSVDVD